MKIEVLLPDDLVASADELAVRLGVSRSEVCAEAIAEYVDRHRGESVTDRLNEVYADEPSGVHPAFRAAQARSVGASEW